MCSVTICGTEGVFSAGLSVPKTCTAHLCSVSPAAAHSFYYCPTDLNKAVTQGTAASTSVTLLGGRGFRSLPQGKNALTVMDGGADLKYGCAMVCDIHGRVMAAISRA